MDDITAFQEFLKVIGSGGAGNALLLGALYFLYRMDKRIQVLEVALGVVKVPQIATRSGEAGFVRASAAAAMIAAALMLAACSGLSGQVLGASVNIGGFTIGVSGNLPAPADTATPGGG